MTDHADAGAPLLIGTQGWKQFLTSKKEMLDAFDGAKEKARAHLVQTSHGNVAEEEFRKWLSGFLPKKYAVTAGYIVSQGVGDEILLPHFEVVIYDQLESPVLWVESDSGLPLEKRPRAVPAEHVRAVLEVKSSLEASSALWLRSSLVRTRQMSGIRSTCRPTFLVAWFSLNCERNMSSAGQHSTILCHAR